ncbi:epoxyqueuosine reductase [Oscillospiraceae bacterium PP1C4]
MKENIKEIFLNLGVDVCGIANINEFTNAPKGFHPKDIYADCKSVIVFAKTLPKGITQVSPRIIYQHFNGMGPVELDRIAYLASIQIEKHDSAYAVPVPADGPYDYWDAEKMEGRGVISMKHAAVLAGIGTLGKSTLLMNSKYGNMLNIGAVLTNLDLPSDLLAEEICIKGCRLCIDSCPAKALDGSGVNQKLCRKCAYESNARGFDVVNCNTCRIICPLAFGKKNSH